MYKAINNFSGEHAKGKLLVTTTKVKIVKGDNYIGEGFSGENIFTWEQDKENFAIKVIAKSNDFNNWYRSGNQTLHKLPKIDI